MPPMPFVHSAAVPSLSCYLRNAAFLSLGIALSLSCWEFLSLFRSMPFSHPSADGPVAAFPRQLAVRQSFGHWTLHGEKLK